MQLCFWLAKLKATCRAKTGSSARAIKPWKLSIGPAPSASRGRSPFPSAIFCCSRAAAPPPDALLSLPPPPFFFHLLLFLFIHSFNHPVINILIPQFHSPNKKAGFPVLVQGHILCRSRVLLVRVHFLIPLVFGAVTHSQFPCSSSANKKIQATCYYPRCCCFITPRAPSASNHLARRPSFKYTQQGEIKLWTLFYPRCSPQSQMPPGHLLPILPQRLFTFRHA